jgi:hypothetical protein
MNGMKVLCQDIVKKFYPTNEKGRDGIYENWSFERLPAIKGMRINLRDHHPILKLFGFLKRLGPAKINFSKFEENRKAVKYCGYLERKMHESVGNPKKSLFYLYLATERSVVYKAVAWRKADPRWYKHTSLKSIDVTMKRMQTMDTDNYIYNRVNILKANGKIRPLGVPAMEWRLYLGIINGWLLHWLKPFMHPSQHGFIPGKGTDTAWQEVIDKVIPTKYIYEVDLKEFYDRINLDYLRNFLIKTGLNPDFVHQIISLSRTAPQPNYIKKSKGKSVTKERSSQ